jgi:hypothetical protein
VPPPKQAAVHQRDGWHRSEVQPLHRLARSRARRAGFAPARFADFVDPLEVGAGLEVLAVAFEHDGTQALRLAQRVERGEQRPSIIAPL